MVESPLAGILSGITAAVVGVIANLALYFAVHTLFSDTNRTTWGPIGLDLPELDALRPVAATIGAVAFVLLFRLKWSVLRTMGACAALGVLAALAGAPLD